MSKALSHVKIVPRRSSERGHADHGWLNTYHTFSFSSYYEPKFQNFGALRILNEDRVAPQTGFPTHPHRDAEIFSYILSGELTHRDSMVTKGQESNGTSGKDDFYRMKRGDVQFTTGGKGIAHSEQNEHPNSWVHFLQIWATPWKRGLTPRYHTRTFSEAAKRQGFTPILSPLKAWFSATAADEKEAVPTIEGTIPIHADLFMGAGLIGVGRKFGWVVGGGGGGGDGKDDGAVKVRAKEGRKVYVHVPMMKEGKASVRVWVEGKSDEEAVLGEGDGAFVEGVEVGDVLEVESIGEEEAEVVVLDSTLVVI